MPYVTQEFLDKNAGRVEQPAITQTNGQWTESTTLLVADAFLFIRTSEEAKRVAMLSVDPFTLEVTVISGVPAHLLSAEIQAALSEMQTKAKKAA